MGDALRVLVVEDEPTNREVAELILIAEGHEVVSVGDGEAALHLCLEERQKFDLILMDVLMPRLDGLEATRRLRADPATAGIPILCMSAKASGSDRRAGMEAGCDHYLLKPFRRAELLLAIGETLRLRGRALK
jgi:CheY-like chemotaxis protein